MARMVGYVYGLKLPWLNEAARLFSESLQGAEYKERLNGFLSFEIDNATRLRKVREILMNIWHYEDEELAPFREEASKLIHARPEDAAAIQLCMVYLAYPVVADICRYMGRMFEFQDEITNAMVRRKLYDEWGERGTLQPIAHRVTQTLKELGFLTAPSHSVYALERHHVRSPDVACFLLWTAMKADGGSYYPFAGLNEFRLLFPFEYAVSKEQLMLDGRFALGNFDGQVCVAPRKPATPGDGSAMTEARKPDGASVPA